MNLKQLSSVLGLSPTTVSRALNGYPEVSEKTRLRVVAAAERHGYVPNALARRLATGRTLSIGHVVPLSEHEMINPIFADFIAGAGETYSARGYRMVISVVPHTDEENCYNALAAEQSVDGVIVHAPRDADPRIPLLNRLGVPFIVHGRADTSWPYAWLDINNRRAFQTLTSHLTALGHRRIALLNGFRGMDFSKRREQGFREALAAVGVVPEPRWILNADMTEPYGYANAKAMLAEPDPPTAFLTSSTITAIGVSRAVAEAGLAMGRDVSVGTHDDAISFLPNRGDPPLFTATKSSIRAAGKRVAEMLIGMIEGTLPRDSTELWEAELVIGTSTGPAPGKDAT